MPLPNAKLLIVPGYESEDCTTTCEPNEYCCDPDLIVQVDPSPSPSANSNTLPSPTNLSNVGELITTASALVAPFAILGFIGSIIYAGYVRMFALGNAEKEQKAMKIAISAAIGFAIIAMSPLLVKVVANLLKVDDTYLPS